jgi:PAS domain-containing protein
MPPELDRTRRYVLTFAAVAAAGVGVQLLFAAERPPGLRVVAAGVVLLLGLVWLFPVGRLGWWGETALTAAAVMLGALALPAPEAVLVLVFATAIRHSFAVSRSWARIGIGAALGGYLVGAAASLAIGDLLTPGDADGPPISPSVIVPALTPLVALLVLVVVVRQTVEAVYARAAVEEELGWTGARLSAVLESSPVGLVLIDQRGIVTVWSAAAERLFGLAAERMLGHPAPSPGSDRLDAADAGGNGTAGNDAERTGDQPALRRQGPDDTDDGWSELASSDASTEERQGLSGPQGRPAPAGPLGLFAAVVAGLPRPGQRGGEYLVRGHRRGTPVVLAVSPSPVLEDDGRYGGILIAVWDVSARLQHRTPERTEASPAG